MRTDFENFTLLTARVLIAVLFVGGFVQKLVEPQAVQTLLSNLNLPEVLVWPALVFNLIVGLGLIIGVYVKPLAFLAAFYCIATSLFHFLPNDPWQMTIFVKNWSIAGGCLALAVAGAGRFAISKT